MDLTLEYKKISIPLKICEAGFRFVLVRPKEKRAFEYDWQNTKNYSYNDAILIEHIEKGGNYGVVGTPTLIIIDLDTEEMRPLLGNLPPTFMVRSGSGRGTHAYFRTNDATPLTFTDTTKTDPKTGKHVNVGQIQAKGKYVVGPTCIHPTGGVYEIINDTELAFVEFTKILEVFDAYIKKIREIKPSDVRRLYGHHHRAFDNIPIEQIAFPVKPINRGAEIQGAHPVHGSSTGMNFSINTVKNVWKCWRCASGGGPLEWLAVREGIIDCADAAPGCLRGDTFLKVLEIARSMSYDVDVPRREITPKPVIVQNVEPVVRKELPEKLSDARITLIRAPPRIGKTRRGVKLGIDAGTANYVTNHHSILEQQKKIFRELKTPGQRAVHICGKDRACRHRMDPEGMPDCDKESCSFYPYTDQTSMAILNSKAANLLYALPDNIMDVENIEAFAECKEDCPYYVIHAAERAATHVFAPVNKINSVSSRSLTVLDEDTTVTHFFPSSAALLERSAKASSHFVTNHLEQQWPAIQRIKERTLKGRKAGRKTILRLIEILEWLRNALIEPDDAPRKTDWQILEEMEQIDTTLEQPSDIPALELLDGLHNKGMDLLAPYLEALLWPYKERRFAWTQGQTRTLCLIADESTPFRDLPDGKIMIIGSTRAELLIEHLRKNLPKNVKDPIEIITINEFPLAKWFTYLVPIPDVASKVRDEKRRRRFSPKQEILGILRSIGGNINSEVRVPALVLSGSSRDQKYVKEHIGGIFHESSNEGYVGHQWNYQWGGLCGFYQNSNISRGVDVPFHRLLVVYSTGFASPYWSAYVEVAIDDRKHDDAVRAQGIIDAILTDETTNSVLRIAPVPDSTSGGVGGWDGDGELRVVVVSQRDMDLLSPYAYKREFVHEMDLRSFANIRFTHSAFIKRVYLNEGVRRENKSTYYSLLQAPVLNVKSSAESLQNEFNAELKNFGDALESNWPKSFKKSDRFLMRDYIIKELIRLSKMQNGRGQRISLKSMLKWLSKRKSAFKPELSLLMTLELVKEGIIIEEGVGDEAMLSIRIDRVNLDGSVIQSDADLARQERALSEFGVTTDVPPPMDPEFVAMREKDPDPLVGIPDEQFNM